MRKQKKSISVYDLTLKAEKAKFHSFDPSEYTEVRGYARASVFQNIQVRSLLSLANRALVCFTRANEEYKTEARYRYTFIPGKEKRKLERLKQLPLPEISLILTSAFKCDRTDFDEAITFCCQKLCESLSDKREHRSISKDGVRTGFNDSLLLSRALEDETFSSSTGNVYEAAHLLGVFSLWKIDRAILAISRKTVPEVANLIIDAQASLEKSEDFFRIEIYKMNKKKSPAEKGSKSRKKYDGLRPIVIEQYNAGLNGQKWKSRTAAAKTIFKSFSQSDQKKFISPEGAVRIVAEWIAEIDPEGDNTNYGKKVYR